MRHTKEREKKKSPVKPKGLTRVASYNSYAAAEYTPTLTRNMIHYYAYKRIF